MANSFTITRNKIQVAADKKIIKAADYLNRIEAGKLIDAALETSDHILSEADREYNRAAEISRKQNEEMLKAREVAKQEGYDAGFAKAQEDYAAKINDALIDQAAFLDQVEYSLVDMLIDSLKAIIGDIGVDRTLRDIATKALRNTSRERFVKLRVHPDRRKSVQLVIDGIKEEFEGIEWLEVVADENLKPEDCLLQTSQGILDFSLDTQLRVLQESLYNRLKKAGAP